MLEIQKPWLLKSLVQVCLLLSLSPLLEACFSTSPGKEKPALKKEAKPEGTIVNQGLYRVNSTVITKEDLENMQKKLGRVRNKKKRKKKALDALVERALVQSEADLNSIIISEARIKKEIEKLSLQQGLSPERFRKKIEKNFAFPFSEWMKELHYKLLKRQLIQIALHVQPPSLKEVKSFYRKNRHRIGIELGYREIVFIPRNKSLEEETRISRIAKNVYNELTYDPQSFARLARASPYNSSRYKRRGGLVPYQSIYDIAQSNPILASILYSNRPGKITRPFRDSLKRYMIVKVEKRRPLPFSKVKNFILSQIYAKKEEETFSKWISKKRKETEILAIP